MPVSHEFEPHQTRSLFHWARKVTSLVLVGSRNGLDRIYISKNCLFHNRTKINKYKLLSWELSRQHLTHGRTKYSTSASTKILRNAMCQVACKMHMIIEICHMRFKDRLCLQHVRFEGRPKTSKCSTSCI